MGRLVRALAVSVAGLVVAAATALAVIASDHGRQTQALVPTTPSTVVESSTTAISHPMAPGSAVRPTTTRPAPSTTLPSAVVKLAGRLDVALAGSNACLVVADGSTLVYSHQPNLALAPASTEKLLVAAAALRVLGPDFRFVSQVRAPAAPVGGRVDSLWLVGSGDALLATPEWIAYQAARSPDSGYPWTPLGSLADMLVGAGIRTVPGGIQGDDSELDRLRFLAAWPPSYEKDQEVGALSALTVNEGFQQWTPAPVLAADPPAHTSSELARLLVSRHVAVGPSGGDQTAPPGSVVIAQLQSVPLTQVIQTMLTASDNLIAELLVRQIDRHSGGTGSTAGGVAIVMQQAAALGVPTAGGVMVDGSGLAPGDRATCAELLGALDVGGRQGFDAIANGLAIAGKTGTLVNRFVGSPITGRLRAKTGSIANAGGMVGVLTLNRPLRFAFLVNQPLTYAQLLEKEDTVVAALATYPETP